MKRFTGILTAAAIAIAPMSASALEALTDSAMNDVTAQAGVSIGLDDIVIYQESVADTTYRDTDGVINKYLDSSYVLGGDLLLETHVGTITDAGVMIDYADNMKKLTVIDGITDGSVYGYEYMQKIFDIDEFIGFADGDDTITTQAAIAAAATVAAADVSYDSVYDTYTYAGHTYAAADVTDNGDDTYDFVAVAEASEDGTYAMDPTNGNFLTSKLAGSDYLTGASPLTIDVGVCEALTTGIQNNLKGVAGAAAAITPGVQVAGVIIGLPTIEISQYHTADIKNVRIVSDNPAAENAGKSFIQIEKTGHSKLAILGGRIEIAPH